MAYNYNYGVIMKIRVILTFYSNIKIIYASSKYSISPLQFVRQK